MTLKQLLYRLQELENNGTDLDKYEAIFEVEAYQYHQIKGVHVVDYVDEHEPPEIEIGQPYLYF